MATKGPASAPRTGLTRVKFGYGHLLETLPGSAVSSTAKRKSDAKRKPSPAIDAPPESSSDEASLVHDEELVDITSPPKAKRVKGPTIRAPRNSSGKKSTSPNVTSTADEMEPSRIPHTNFTSSKRNTGRQDGSETKSRRVKEDVEVGIKHDFDDPFSVFHSSPPKGKRPQSTYTKLTNIHASTAAHRESKPVKKSVALVKEEVGGFRNADQGLLDAIGMCPRLLLFGAKNSYNDS